MDCPFDEASRPTLPDRSKYAAMFESGVEVVVHTDRGDEVHRFTSPYQAGF